jgi:hypothetical protein
LDRLTVEMRRLLAFAVVLALPLLAGCRAGFFAAGVLTGVAIAAHPAPEVVVYEPEPEPAVLIVPTHVPPAAPARPDAGPRFDQGAARNALDSVDLDACKAEGLPPGYGHARVTFAKDGRVRKIVIDGPAGLSPEAVRCVGNALGTAEVDPFDSAPVTVPTTWHVK